MATKKNKGTVGVVGMGIMGGAFAKNAVPNGRERRVVLVVETGLEMRPGHDGFVRVLLPVMVLITLGLGARLLFAQTGGPSTLSGRVFEDLKSGLGAPLGGMGIALSEAQVGPAGPAAPEAFAAGP